ncbi:hypothetical protein [Leifsonia sp. EB41]|uniref:hypothetical protein n=1 Tax=Leifsonia sp. EB41 TaxID=3156260 RepID=UPI003513A746
MAQPLGAGLPGVEQRDDVVDLDERRRLHPTGERDAAAGVRVAQGAGEDRAVRAPGGRGEVAGEDVVPRVAAVPVDVEPRLAEAGDAVVPGRGRAALHRELSERGTCA